MRQLFQHRAFGNEFNNKKAEELKFGRFFIDRFNAHYKLDYEVAPNEEDKSDIDIYATAENRDTLNFQLKTGEPGLEHFWGSRAKRGSGMVIIDTNIEQHLSQIIRDSEKHYSNKEKLILLITERFQPVFDAIYSAILASKLGNSAFMGMYIVKLPNFAGDPMYKGQVVAIKDIFGNHGTIF